MANVGTGTAGKVLTATGVTSSSAFKPIGTDSGLTAHGVVLSQGTGAFSATAVGNAGQVLTANSLSDPTWQDLPASGISGTTTKFDVIIGNGASSVVSVGPGSSGQVLQSGGNAANPAYSTATYPSTATGAGKILRADGTNWSASTATYPDVATGTGKILRADGTNWTPTTATYPDTAGTSGNLLQSDGTNWASVTVAIAIQTNSTWTPAIAFGGGTTGITYTTQTGTYYKIGNVVFIYAKIVLSSKGSSTGNLTITGLPFTSTAVVDLFMWTAGISTSFPVGTAAYAETSASSTVMTTVAYGSSTATANFTNTNMANTSTIGLSGFYFA
jgi:hypothetical protein